MRYGLAVLVVVAAGTAQAQVPPTTLPPVTVTAPFLMRCTSNAVFGDLSLTTIA